MTYPFAWGPSAREQRKWPACRADVCSVRLPGEGSNLPFNDRPRCTADADVTGLDSPLRVESAIAWFGKATVQPALRLNDG